MGFTLRYRYGATSFRVASHRGITWTCVAVAVFVHRAAMPSPEPAGARAAGVRERSRECTAEPGYFDLGYLVFLSREPRSVPSPRATRGGT